MDKEILISCDITEGYAFRTLVQYLKQTNLEGRFYFTIDGLHYNQMNGTQTILNDILIKRSSFTKYIFNGEEDDIHLVGLTLSSFNDNTKNIAKNDTISLCVYKGESKLIFTISTNGRLKIRGELPIIDPAETEMYELPNEYFPDEDAPIVTCDIKEFVERCQTISKSRVDKILVKSTTTGINMSATIEASSQRSEVNFGELYKEIASNGKNRFVFEEEENQMYVDKNDVKALAKISNMCSGKIKLYIVDDSPLKIYVNFAGIGEVRIYLYKIK